ncbi:MAG: L,D-transpeptidase family protein [Thermoanaerobaculia bacterium]
MQIEAIVAAGRTDLLSHPHLGDLEESVRAVYAARNYELLWTSRRVATRQAKEVAGFIASVANRGLEPADYDVAAWPERFAAARSASLESRAELDLAFTVTVMRLVSDLYGGRVNPTKVEFVIESGSESLDLPAFVARVAASEDAVQQITTSESEHLGYQKLITALKQFRAMDKAAEGIVLTKVKVVEPGSEYADLPKLVLLLRELGDLPPGEIPDPETTLYAGPIVEAVKRFQVRHGLEADGRIGGGTFLAINIPLSARVRQIEHALERWRWAPRKFDRPPIVVNLPEYSLRAFDEKGQPAIVMKVVVGSAARGPTPVLSGPIERVVFQPYWNVPYSILKNEILPQLDAGYLAKHEMEIVDLKLQQQPLNDESRAGLRAGKLRLRQRPGAKNSLGPVKFAFENVESIFLHGTPSQELFDRSRRDFSHGCIRGEDPERLAAWLLRDEPKWTPEKIRKALVEGPAQGVKLKQPTPLLILYGTAIVTEDDQLHFFDDIYGIDELLDAELAKPRWQPVEKKAAEAVVAAKK